MTSSVAPAPKEFQLYAYQQNALDFLDSRDGGAGLFMEMGTGKSRTALAYLSQAGVRRVVIVCPISVAGVWEREITKVGLDWRVVNLTYGKLPNRVARLKKLRQETEPTALIINYESYWRQAIAKELLLWRPEAVICDEAHRLKGRATQQSRFAMRFANASNGPPLVKHRLALTGTPVTNGLEDLFSIYRFIDQNVFGTRWAEFQNRYLVMGGFERYKIVGYQNQEEIRSKLERTSFQISKADALDLPERTDVIMPVTLTLPTKAKYEEIRKFAVAEIEGLDEDGRPKSGTVLARIVLSTILRLQQISCGFVKTTDGEELDISSEKLDTCTDIVSDAVAEGHKVVVFTRFVHDLHRLHNAIADSVILDGSTKHQEREPLLDDFRAGRYKVLLCQIQVGSLGIDLTTADIAVFYSTGFSLAEYLQARDRLHRHGQTQKVTTYYLVGSPVDEKIIQALIAKQQVARQVVNLDYAKKLLGQID